MKWGRFRSSVMLSAFLWAFLVWGEVVCGTWNLQWFPSGRAEHRAPKKVEEANISAAAGVIRAGLESAKATDAILFFQELRDASACANLVAKVGRPDLSVVAVSAFREWDRRLGWQQCGIATTLPVIETSWSYWRHPQKVSPPRGYVYAVLDGGEQGLIACFCLHLKSNYGAAKPEVRALKVRKREIAAAQIVDLSRKIRTRDGRGVTHIVVAGDFNMDPYSGQFADEKTYSMLKGAGFATGWDGLPLSRRGTHPGRGRYPDSTLDFIFHRGFVGADEPTLGPVVSLSDHRMVWQRLK